LASSYCSRLLLVICDHPDGQQSLYLSTYFLNAISPSPFFGFGHVVQTYIALKGSHLVWWNR